MRPFRRAANAGLFTGIRRPRRTSAGSEFAGRVDDVGAAVTEFRVGDEVFGIANGANAEYVTVRESGAIAQKPTGLTFEEAAAVPDGSLLALTCLRPAYPLRGKNVLVYGAAGSIGTAAVQLLAHEFEADRSSRSSRGSSGAGARHSASAVIDKRTSSSSRSSSRRAGNGP